MGLVDIATHLDKLTTEEKIQIMEAVWEDLCKNVENFKSPDWHQGILQDRERQVNKRESQFTDWDQAKKQIRNTVT